jgi:hypothetical protein
MATWKVDGCHINAGNPGTGECPVDLIGHFQAWINRGTWWKCSDLGGDLGLVPNTTGDAVGDYRKTLISKKGKRTEKRKIGRRICSYYINASEACKQGERDKPRNPEK